MVDGCPMNDCGLLDDLRESSSLHGQAEGIVGSFPVVHIEVSTHYSLWAVNHRKDMFSEFFEFPPIDLIRRAIDNQDIASTKGKFET